MKNLKNYLETAYISEYFKAEYDSQSYEYNLLLSERQLFTQSNARVLLGHDNVGRLHFIAIPHKKDYPLPAGRMSDGNQHIDACVGMYYQTDLTLFLGKLFLSVHLENGQSYANGNDSSITRYANDYLPWTNTGAGAFEMNTVSIAPVLERPNRKAFKHLPLPGPSGAIYAVEITNTSNDQQKGMIRVNFDDKFMSKFAMSWRSVEERAYPSQYKQVDQRLLLMERPEGYAGIHLNGGSFLLEGDVCQIEKDLDLAPGESTIVEVYVCVGETPDDISEAVSILYCHDVVDWILYTDDFWKSTLGSLNVSAKSMTGLAQISRDMHIRNILDNFNCIQTDEFGRVLVHWQGAPSHCIGRMWGIDVEPTSLSFVHALPELTAKIITYMVDRNEPRYSPYPDHSTPIMMAPLIMAGEYLKYTGDVSYFKKNEHVYKRLIEIWETLSSFLHAETGLLPSKFSSDGKVFRKYDHGTNGKFYYAAECFALLRRMVEGCAEQTIKEIAAKVAESVQNHMAVDGPFGKQFSGGVNLGEQDDFYFNDDYLYYDGEDSSSAIAPIYGIYPFTDEKWMNYHRFARSVFASNFDVEMGTLRWFPYGGAVDGTAFISAIGGSITREEMRDCMQNMVDKAVDVNGSLYWWPRGKDARRKVSRCSQGQGAFVVQYLRQWLGLDYDAKQNLLVVRPLGMLDSFVWKDARLGNHVFDLAYDESDVSSTLKVYNKTDQPLRVVFEARPYGAGAAASSFEKDEMTLSGYEDGTIVLSAVLENEDISVNIPQIEGSLLSDDGIVFAPFGHSQPWIENLHRENVFMLRYVIINAKEQPLENVGVCITIPHGFQIARKEECIWEGEKEFAYEGIEIPFDCVPPKSRQVVSLWVKVDEPLSAESVFIDKHSFIFGEEATTSSDLWIKSGKEKSVGETINARLTFSRDGERKEKNFVLNIVTLSEKECQKKVTEIYGARAEAKF